MLKFYGSWIIASCLIRLARARSFVCVLLLRAVCSRDDKTHTPAIHCHPVAVCKLIIMITNCEDYDIDVFLSFFSNWNAQFSLAIDFWSAKFTEAKQNTYISVMPFDILFTRDDSMQCRCWTTHSIRANSICCFIHSNANSTKYSLTMLIVFEFSRWAHTKIWFFHSNAFAIFRTKMPPVFVAVAFFSGLFGKKKHFSRRPPNTN